MVGTLRVREREDDVLVREDLDRREPESDEPRVDLVVGEIEGFCT